MPDVVVGPSHVSVPGARAFHLPSCANPADAGFMIGREFAHLHPPDDGSLHMSLPAEIVRTVVDNGWAELHPLAGKHGLPGNIVMVYGPRDDAELQIVAALVRASHDAACRQIVVDLRSTGRSRALQRRREPPRQLHRLDLLQRLRQRERPVGPFADGAGDVGAFGDADGVVQRRQQDARRCFRQRAVRGHDRVLRGRVLLQMAEGAQLLAEALRPLFVGGLADPP